MDLGPSMADLLKRLIKQNIAVGYIGRILAAIREVEKHPNNIYGKFNVTGRRQAVEKVAALGTPSLIKSKM